MYDLIQEVKGAVEAVREHAWALTPQQVTDFHERYRQIIESGMRENPVQESAGTILKRGRKKQSKAKNLPDRCQNVEINKTSILKAFNCPSIYTLWTTFIYLRLQGVPCNI